MQEVAIARVIDSEQEAEDPVGIATAAVDVVGEGGWIVRAMADDGGEGLGGAKGGEGCEQQEEDKGEQCGYEEGEKPFPLSSHNALVNVAVGFGFVFLFVFFVYFNLGGCFCGSFQNKDFVMWVWLILGFEGVWGTGSLGISVSVDFTLRFVDFCRSQFKLSKFLPQNISTFFLSLSLCLPFFI